ncbi:MAG: hypothetical protein HONDAALG_02411 [Gammaproteobacteria bacterium]|nr:hypothetical protein [Gammaproteobacteria bacterium]
MLPFGVINVLQRRFKRRTILKTGPIKMTDLSRQVSERQIVRAKRRQREEQSLPVRRQSDQRCAKERALFKVESAASLFQIKLINPGFLLIGAQPAQINLAPRWRAFVRYDLKRELHPGRTIKGRPQNLVTSDDFFDGRL